MGEDLILLEHGFLRLVFRVCPYQGRAVSVRVPQHYCLDATDEDECWERDCKDECWEIDCTEEALSTREGSVSIHDSESSASCFPSSHDDGDVTASSLSAATFTVLKATREFSLLPLSVNQ